MLSKTFTLILFSSLGVFVGNWLLVPLIIRKGLTYRDGFYIGLIAGLVNALLFSIYILLIS